MDNIQLNISSPKDLDKYNKTQIDVKFYFIESEGSVGNGKDIYHFKYIKLLLNNEVCKELEVDDKNKSNSYVFEAVDFTEYANTGFPVAVKVIGYSGKSSSSNYILSNPVNIIIDTISPRVSDLNPVNGSYINNTGESIKAMIIDDGGSHIDRNSIKLIVDSNPVDAGQIEKTIISNDRIQITYKPENALIEKEYIFQVSLKDMAGNPVTSEATKFLIDTTPPDFKSIDPPDGSMLNTLSPELKAVVAKKGGSPLDIDTVNVIFDGKIYSIENAPTWITTSWPASDLLEIRFMPAIFSEGFHSIIYKIKDKAGNEAVSKEYHFTLDVTPPEIINITPEGSSIEINSSPKITAFISDKGGAGIDQKSIKLILNGSNYDPVIKTSSVNTGALKGFEIEYQSKNLPEGENIFSFLVRDNAGNETISNKTSFIIDTTAPVAESVFPNGLLDKSVLKDSVFIEVSDLHSGINPEECSAVITTSDNTIINLTSNGGEIISPAVKSIINFGNLNHIGLLGIGKHKLTLKLKDIVGNSSEKSYEFEISHAVPFDNNNFQALQSFMDINDQVANEPYCLPPDFSYGEDILVDIPNVVVKSSTWKSEVENMEASVKKGENKLTIKIFSSAVWSCDPAARTTFKENFEKLLDNIESKEGSLFLSGIILMVQNRVVRSLPLSFSEVLPWCCGIDRYSRAVSLLPGFRLRIGSASFQYCGPGKDQINGMIPTGEMILPVNRQRNSDGTLITSLNPMVTGLSQTGYTASEERTDGMIGSIADLHSGDLKRKHLAVVLPATIPSSASASSVMEEHVAIVAADSLNALSNGILAATGEYTESTGFVVRRFRGRTGLSVEIPIVLDGKDSFVPVGTTLRQIGERKLHWFTPELVKKGQIKWTRQWFDNLEGEAPVSMRETHWVDLGVKPENSSVDFADSPILPGDNIEIRL